MWEQCYQENWLIAYRPNKAKCGPFSPLVQILWGGHGPPPAPPLPTPLCDDNRKRFAIIVAFAVYVPHWNVRYFICGSSRSNAITANMLRVNGICGFIRAPNFVHCMQYIVARAEHAKHSTLEFSRFFLKEPPTI